MVFDLVRWMRLSNFLAGEELCTVTMKRNMSKRNLEDLIIYQQFSICLLSLLTCSIISWKTLSAFKGLTHLSQSCLDIFSILWSIQYNITLSQEWNLIIFASSSYIPRVGDYSRPGSLRIIFRILFTKTGKRVLL